MANQPATFDPSIAHITDALGNIYQVLCQGKTIQSHDASGRLVEIAIPDGSDWDEAATRAAYDAAVADE